MPKKSITILFWTLLATIALTGIARAQAPASPAAAPAGVRIQFDQGDSPGDVSRSLQLFLIFTALSLAPSAMIMMTSFTRILIVFGFLRRALGTQSSPPNQIVAGLALFLTIFIMAPVIQSINEQALQPYMDETITQAEAWKRGLEPLHTFMAGQTGEKELVLFLDLAEKPTPGSMKEVTMDVLIPAFMLSELKTAFQMGFLIFLPFLVIDLFIASSLMSMGMMMLPPMMISLPVKIFFFVLADGWTLTVRGLVSSFAT
jgi:flagellar biosynthesis protein FliP